MRIAFFVFHLVSLVFTWASLASDLEGQAPIKRVRVEKIDNGENLDPQLEGIINSAYMPCEAIIMAGKQYFAKKNYDRASDAFDKCPITDIAVLRVAIKANVSAKRYARASELYQQISQPSITDKRNAVLVYVSAKNYRLAITEGLSLIHMPSSEIQDSINLATAYFLNSNFDQARELFRTIPVESITHNEDRARAVCSSFSDGDFKRGAMLCDSILSGENTISDKRWVASRYVMLKDYERVCNIYELILNGDHTIKDLLAAAKYNFLNKNIARAREIAEVILSHKDCTQKIREYVLETKKLLSIAK